MSRDRKIERRAVDASALRSLEPAALAAVVEEVGLEDAGEIAALMSPAQLAGVLDHDLWKSARPGDEERFDAARFGLWLEVLLEMGADKAAARLLELDAHNEDVVALGLSRIFLVFETDTIALSLRGDDDEGAQVDKLLESSATTELDGWFLVARGAAHTDAALAVVVELDAHHREDLDRVLHRIAALTDVAADDAGGLLALLTADEQLESDAAGARLDRREAQGFVSPPDARAFLRLCDAGAVTGDDAVSRAYLGPVHARTRAAELAFLANVLVVHEGLAPADAARRALALCMRGLRALPAAMGEGAAERSLLPAFARGRAGG